MRGFSHPHFPAVPKEGHLCGGGRACCEAAMDERRGTVQGPEGGGETRTAFCEGEGVRDAVHGTLCE